MKKYNEAKLEQEPIGDNEFYCRYTLEPKIRRVNVSSTSIQFVLSDYLFAAETFRHLHMQDTV
jgi:hypothetical protein